MLHFIVNIDSTYSLFTWNIFTFLTIQEMLIFLIDININLMYFLGYFSIFHVKQMLARNIVNTWQLNKKKITFSHPKLQKFKVKVLKRRTMNE